MEHSDALLTLAEFSIALAGFMGVIVVFGRRSGGWHPIDSFRIQTALSTSIGPAFLSLIPIGLHMFGLPPSAVWRASSLLFAIYLVASMFFTLRAIRRLDPSSLGLMPLIARCLNTYGSGVVLVAQLLTVFGVWSAPAPGAYFLGLVFALYVAAFLFVRIVFVRPPE